MATQPYNLGDETHIGGGDTSAFVVPSATIARALLAIKLLGMAQEDSDHTAVIAVVHFMTLTYRKLTMLAKM